MRVVLQRVSRAEVRIGDRVSGAIGRGYCLLVGFTHADTTAEVDWMVEKVSGLRLFSDDAGKMNLSLADVGGAVLVVSQFTLYGDASKGRRPSFIDAARPEQAIPLYERFVAGFRERGVPVQTGEFGAMMEVTIENEGPVTMLLEGEQRRAKESKGEQGRARGGRVITLASGSPRRLQLLQMLGFEVQVRPSAVQEVMLPRESPAGYARRLARDKARAVPGEYVLGADTIVVVDGAVLEKPRDADDALAMLLQLQGRRHEVITAVCLVANGQEYEAQDVTAVYFRPAGEALLRAYVATGEPLDKAGAYGIQGYGAALVERVEGDFFGVMGLPVRLVLDLLERAGEGWGFGGQGEQGRARVAREGAKGAKGAKESKGE